MWSCHFAVGWWHCCPLLSHSTIQTMAAKQNERFIVCWAKKCNRFWTVICRWFLILTVHSLELNKMHLNFRSHKVHFYNFSSHLKLVWSCIHLVLHTVALWYINVVLQWALNQEKIYLLWDKMKVSSLDHVLAGWQVRL